MKQKLAFEDNCFFDSFKDPQATGSKRSSLNIPDCSAVTDNQNNCYLTETNEISWLQKFAEENQKVCNSGLFEDNGSSSKAPIVINEMKFSFNMNYTADAKQKEEHIFADKNNRHFEVNGKGVLQIEEYSSRGAKKEGNVLTDIQNTEGAKTKTRKDSIVGSIKKNQKAKPVQAEITDYQRQIAECTPFSKLQEMNDKLTKALRNDQFPTVTTGKQNVKRDEKIKESEASSQCSSPFVTAKMPKEKFEDNERYFQRINEMQTKSRASQRSTFFENPIIVEKKQENPSLNYQTLAFQSLFNRIDRSQMGKLTKANCSTDFIPQDFKFIFGNIFTRIKFKQFSYNKREFVKLCQIAIKEIDSAQVNDLLKTFVPSPNEEIGKPAPSKKIMAEEQWSKGYETKKNYRFDTFQPLDFKRSLSPIESGGKDSTKLSFIQVQNEADQKYRNHRSTAASIKKASMDRPVLKKSLIFDENVQMSPFATKKSMLQKDLFDPYNESSSYKRRNSSINELTLQQHKKSLESLNMLNKRMQSCLSTNVLCQHSKSSYGRQKSLNFDQLVKHV